MKLAEALQERADLKRRIDQLQSRLEVNATTQENEEPAEDPKELMKELDHAYSRLQELITKINLTNAITIVNGMTLTECIARKDVLTDRVQAYQRLIYSASSITNRATRSEIKIVRTIDVKATQKKLDQISKELRQLDNAIQSANWTTEI